MYVIIYSIDIFDGASLVVMISSFGIIKDNRLVMPTTYCRIYIYSIRVVSAIQSIDSMIMRHSKV